jgi:hypothetical protein
MPEREQKLLMALGYIAGRIIAIGLEEGIVIRWGGDWDRDGSVLDQKFDDLFHFEIVELPNDDDADKEVPGHAGRS